MGFVGMRVSWFQGFLVRDSWCTGCPVLPFAPSSTSIIFVDGFLV